MARFEKFADLLLLDVDALRAIFLRSDDAPERLWAAWALGMRHEKAAASVLHEGAAREPTAGVRAHLTLMLVAHGEIDAAAALARFDPDAIVRASACRHLARIAKATDAPLCSLLVERFDTDSSSDVRKAIVDGMRDDSPTALLDRCRGLLSSNDEDMRAAAIDSMLRRTGPSSLDEALRAHLRIEPSSDLRETLIDAWCTREGPLAAVREMCTWEAHHVIRALDVAANRTVPLGPGELEPLLTRRESEIRMALAERAEAEHFEPPFAWLAGVVLSVLEPGSDHTPAGWSAATIALRLLSDRLERRIHASLSKQELEIVSRLRAVFEHEVERAVPEEAALAPSGYVEWEDELPELVVIGMKLLPVLERLDVGMN